MRIKIIEGKPMFFYGIIALFFGWNILLSCPEGWVDDPNDNYECVPEEFEYHQSPTQGFCLFEQVVINGSPISNDDWVGAFNGDVCVGSKAWDISQCNNGVCDLPIMGDNDDGWTVGYLENGDPVSFKIYDVSEGTYTDATPIVLINDNYVVWDVTFSSTLDDYIDLLYATVDIDGCMDACACNYDPYADNDDGSCEYFSCDYVSCNPSSQWDADEDGVLDNYHDYEFNGSMTAMVFDGSTSYGEDGDMIAAFIGGEQRGVGLADQIPAFFDYGGEYAFPMMVYSNESNEGPISFKFFDQSSNLVYNLSTTTDFETDMIVGDVQNPFVLDLDLGSLSIDNPLPTTFRINTAYPNPFNPTVTIQFEVVESTVIGFTFYNIRGEKVDYIDYGYTRKGIYDIQWSPNLPSGTYLVVMQNSEKNMHQRKITLIK